MRRIMLAELLLPFNLTALLQRMVVGVEGNLRLLLQGSYRQLSVSLVFREDTGGKTKKICVSLGLISKCSRERINKIWSIIGSG